MSKTLAVSNLATTTGSGSIVVPTGVNLISPGSVIQVTAARSGPRTQTISSITPVAVENLAVTITPLQANSRILINVQVSGSDTYVNSYAIYKNGFPTVSTTGFTNSNEPNMQATTYRGGNDAGLIYSSQLTWSEIAGDTGTRTYQVYCSSGYSGTAYTTYINNRSSGDMAAFSVMVCMEVAQ